ncbi:MAG: hypothetical protein QM831_25510 [Kofleriaceae bacterium]
MLRFLVLIVLASVAAADPLPDVLELAPLTGSPCDVVAGKCTKLQTLKLKDVGSVDVYRISSNDPTPSFTIELALHMGDTTLGATLDQRASMCGTGTCRDYHFKAAKLVMLKSQEVAFGVELEATADVSHTFKDMGAPYTEKRSLRVACVIHGDVDCKTLDLGYCEATGWTETRVLYRCAGTTDLGTFRDPDTNGISQEELAQISDLEMKLTFAGAGKTHTCQRLAAALTAIFDDHPEALDTIRRLAPNVPKSISRRLGNSMMHIDQECLRDKSVLDQIARIGK